MMRGDIYIWQHDSSSLGSFSLSQTIRPYEGAEPPLSDILKNRPHSYEMRLDQG